MPKSVQIKNKNTVKSKTKKTLVLLDAHAIIHRAYHALPEFASSKGEPTGALYGVVTMVLRIVAEFKPDYIVACYDLPGKTFRHESYEGYKAGRKKTDDALMVQIERSRDVFAALNIPIYAEPGFEADDILGTITSKVAKDTQIEIIIASGDMDTLQLVDAARVRVFTLKKGLNDTVLYDEKAIIDRFGFGPLQIPDFKGLKGDPSDNIIGVPGIGDKTATTLIQAFGTVEGIYRALKKDHSALLAAGITERIMHILKEHEEEAIFSKTLATIRRDAPIEFILPHKEWKEGIVKENIQSLFKELEFKSLIDRFERSIDSEEIKEEPALVSTEDKEHINQDALQKLAIALWLINSESTNPTLDDIYAYAGTHIFADAEKKILAEVKAQGLEKVYTDIEVPLIPIIEAAKNWGVCIDPEHFAKLSKKYHVELSGIEKKIYTLAGKKFNINSPKQLGVILFDDLKLVVRGLKKTAGGARSTRESELEKLKDAHPIIEKILEYRELQKLLSTYIDTIPAMADENGRLHSTLNQTGTTTGRMSSQNPNMQNIPVRGEIAREIRKGFVASPGHVFVACDYSQIEMRVLALLSEDEKLLDTFKKEKDVHASVASFVFKVPEAAVTSDMRRQAKVINFGIIYGMGVTALKATLGSTREEAERFYNDYFETFPSIRMYFEKVKNEAARRGYTETLFGRRRYFPGLKSKIPYVRAMAERMAMNAPLQGTAADIIKIAMREVDRELKQQNLVEHVHLVMQIHDELIYEVAESVEIATRELVRRVMENAIEARLPFSANVSSGKNWGELA
ncbi:MAG: DNA polymerase [Candidatus Pacebacteria bacterium]|jgi:DNA polymerase-1|nr:DNA polymerase [Candidatus Paceibacterota bacterium]